MNFVYVGVGGAIGSMFRYAVSLLPIPGNFPFATLIVNFLGAIIIGILSELQIDKISPQANLLWKTGFCGGFTTFSTFSLEAFGLLEKGATGLGIFYIGISLIGCLTGILIGRLLVSTVLP